MIGGQIYFSLGKLQAASSNEEKQGSEIIEQKNDIWNRHAHPNISPGFYRFFSTLHSLNIPSKLL